MSFKGFLKGNTAATIKHGPFVDSTDGNTAETALTISQADVRLSKNGGNFAQKNEATAATHDELGYYDVALDATDTNTYGMLTVATHETGALSVSDTYMVLPEIVYDSLFPAASGDPLPAFGLETWGKAITNGTTGSFTLSGGTAYTSNILVGKAVRIDTGTGANAMRFISANATTGSVSVSPAFDIAPNSTSEVSVIDAPPSSTANPVPADVVQISGDSVAADNLESYCDGTTPQPVNATQISGDAVAADNLEAAFDGTGYDLGGIDVSELNAIVDDLINGGRLDLLIDAIKAKTDSLTFTVGNQVDANIQSINDVTITGNGGTGTEFSV